MDVDDLTAGEHPRRAHAARRFQRDVVLGRAQRAGREGLAHEGRLEAVGRRHALFNRIHKLRLWRSGGRLPRHLDARGLAVLVKDGHGRPDARVGAASGLPRRVRLPWGPSFPLHEDFIRAVVEARLQDPLHVVYHHAVYSACRRAFPPQLAAGCHAVVAGKR